MALSGLKLFLFSTFLSTVSASLMFSNMVLHEQRDSAPDGFIKTAAAPAEHVLNLRLALLNSDIAGLEQAFYNVSLHGGPFRGYYLTKEEVEAFVKPTSKSVSIVNEFLASYGVSAKPISPAGDWLAFSVPVSKANEMFHANFSVFQHVETGKKFVRTLAYSIPTELRAHLELVHPTITFENPVSHGPIISSPLSNIIVSEKSLTARQNVPSSCNFKITPACLQALYGFPATLATQSSNGSLSDVPTTFISVGVKSNVSDALDGLLDAVNFLLNETNPPHTLTTSYVQNENTPEGYNLSAS
ncbi:Pro-kumamolisin, activation domain-containing protein [Phellopilus nigrolimitatus]|nr:Pro-kumamolisin, activation domain-containing protein [Phellopilus nigrolimitatus]